MSSVIQRIAGAHLSRHPEESARVLERLTADEIVGVLREAPAETAAGVLACFAPNLAGRCLARWSGEDRSRVVVRLPAWIAAALLRQLEPAVREKVLHGFSKAERAPLERALSYPEGSAGALADPSALTLHSDLTVEEALTRLGASGRRIPSRLFVLDRSQQLVGSVTPGVLLGSRRDARVSALPPDPVRPLPAYARETLVALAPQLEPVAVVDLKNAFLGVIEAETLERLAGHEVRPQLLHPVAAMGELYWLGLREIFGGFSSGSRLGGTEGGAQGANG